VRVKTFTLSILAAIIISAGLTTLGFMWWMNGIKSQPTNLINQITNGNAVILNQFNAIGNLQGFVVQSSHDNNQSIIYADNQGRYIIMGTIIGADGRNISEQNFQQYIAPQSANVAFSYIGSTAWIQQGANTAPHQLYVIFDPNCIYCHRLYDALQPFIKKGQLAVRWLPVAFLKATSTGRAYALLSSSNPLQTLAQNENNFDESSENGGVPPLNNPSAAVQQQLQNNMAFLTEAQINATPALLYKTVNGSAKLDMGMIDATKLKDLISNVGKSF
jgi:thiol:disulfide interchange protein DsbG